MKNQRDNNEIK